MSKRTRSAIDAGWNRIEPCEQRLALSASLATDLLLDVLDLHSESPSESPDLLNQAVQLRGDHGLDGSGQTVAVIDSGVAWDHIALGGGFGPGYRVVGGWDFAESDADPYDDGPAGYHGTHVTGLLAGQSEGFAGVAPGADIVALRVFDDAGNGQLQWIESALQWVHQNQNEFESPITTVNLSVGAALTQANRDEAMAMIEDELQLLRDDNILVFAASGNLFASQPAEDVVLYPASSPSVVAVTSIDTQGGLSDFAQRESGILATRGESIPSAVPDHVFGWDGRVDDFAALDGTSMATPQLAGASMLVRQSMIDQGLEPTADEILQRLRQSATERVDSLTGATYHMVDLASALDQAAEATPPIDRFDGTNGSEKIELDLREGVTLRVGEMTYRLDDDLRELPLVIDVGGGDDSLQIIGSPRSERLVMRAQPGEAGLLTSGDLQIELRGFEQVAFAGGGGSDRATLFDSSGNDTLKSNPTGATLSGVGFQFQVTDVSRIYVHGTAGGNDTAFLHDSAGDDSLAVRPQFTSMRGDGFFQLAYGFERVYAYATAGGFDSAELYDSAGDDTMSVSANRTMIAGTGYQVSARGFDSVIGHATSGGDDLAMIYGDPSHNQWHSTADMVQWTGQDNALRLARGFERTSVFENYQPVQLTPQSIPSAISPWSSDDPQQQAEKEAAALRSIFEDLGKA